MQQVLTGTAVVPGVGIGPVVRPAAAPALDLKADPTLTVDEASTAFAEAARTVAERLRQRANSASGAAAEILLATAGLAQDRGLATFVGQHLADGKNLPGAIAAAVADLSEMFTKLGGLMAERVTDLQDVRDRITAEVLGLSEPGVPHPDHQSVLCADDLAPADTAGLDPERIVAIATQRGGPTSHTAIIARQLGIPCVVAVAQLDLIEPGTRVLVDGTSGSILIEPDAAEGARLIERDAQLRDAASRWVGPGQTRDGHRVQLLANVQDGATARSAAQLPIDGFGLYRTELGFLDSATEPTVAAQAATYSEVLAAVPGKKVIVRTLDAGSDKPVPYAALADEPNPALGVRGVRIAFDQPGLLDRQLDAIAQAAAENDADVRVMAPMIATESEAIWFAERVRQRGLPVGAMIETPSAAILAARLFRHLDFVSIGTNDLSQYTLAADRMAPTLSDLTDPWQPALLELIRIVAEAGRAADKPVGVCGEAAAHPDLAAVLTGLGVTSLSCAAPAIREVGAALAGLTYEQCVAAADAATAAVDAKTARQAATQVLHAGG